MSAGKELEKPKEQSSIRHPQTHYHVLMGGQQFVVVRHSNVWRPPTDVMEEGDRLIVLVEIAGMQHGEFHVAVSNRELIISGVRPVPEKQIVSYHQLEVRSGDFRTEISLPWRVDEGNIKARYEDGFLRVVLPRRQPEQMRVINVEKDEE